MIWFRWCASAARATTLRDRCSLGTPGHKHGRNKTGSEVPPSSDLPACHRTACACCLASLKGCKRPGCKHGGCHPVAHAPRTWTPMLASRTSEYRCVIHKDLTQCAGTISGPGPGCNHTLLCANEAKTLCPSIAVPQQTTSSTVNTELPHGTAPCWAEQAVRSLALPLTCWTMETKLSAAAGTSNVDQIGF